MVGPVGVSCSQSEKEKDSATIETSDSGSEFDNNTPRLASFGHGSYFSANGERIELTIPVVRKTQEHLIEKWSGEFGTGHAAAHENHEDPIVSNYFLIVDLLDAASDAGYRAPWDVQVNNAVFAFYINEVGLEDLRTARQALITQESGAAYRAECASHSVPIPDSVLDSSWTNHGVLTTNFVGLEAELWSWESSSPDGLCLALPRWNSQDQAPLFGIICMGRESSKVCYFDNPNMHPQYGTESFDRWESHSIEKFLGGADLVLNQGGVCSDCHAGQNPFVVHPNDPAFIDLDNTVRTHNPAQWHEPIVSGTIWPENPGPTAFPPGSGNCSTCHASNSDHPLPILSSATPGYCGDILENALRYTMPQGAPPAAITDEVDFLREMCSNNPPIYGPGYGTVNPSSPPDTIGFLSPPIVDEPLYECSTKVGIRGARLNSLVHVFVDGSHVTSQTIRNPDYTSIDVPQLSSGQIVTARQEVNGVISSVSNEVEVKHYLEDYPGGVPRPKISPRKTHECAYRIAVEHLPGATLVVESDSGGGGSPGTQISVGGARGYSAAPAHASFVDGQSVQVRQELCGDSSQWSTPVTARPEPNFIPKVTIDPIDVYEQQELFTFTSIVRGATIPIHETSVGYVDTISSWPLNRKTNYDFATPFGRAFLPGDEMLVEQGLCSGGEITEISTTKSCQDLEPPEVLYALTGQNYLIISRSIPGATIRVYDPANNEIGDGAGSIILLSRPLVANETLLVVQDLGPECASTTSLEIVVAEQEGQPIPMEVQ